MKPTLKLLVASTALTAAIGVPAWSAMYAPSEDSLRSVAALFEEDEQKMPLVLASGDDDDDDDHRYRENARYGHDDEHEHEYEDDDCDEEDECRGSARNPARAGTVTPPQNGLFGTGPAPKVQMN